ncbi:MAG: hypothetical protein AAF641_16790 [Pseudomonadota bacterium]
MTTSTPAYDPSAHRANSPSAQKRKAIVHLGLNKTGSTSIQTWLRTNKSALLKQGFHYDPFEDGKHPQWPHADVIAIASLNSDDPDLLSAFRLSYGIRTPEEYNNQSQLMKTAFANSLSEAGDRTVILSSETLGVWATGTGLVGPVCEFLRKYFDEFTIVTYVREQADWLASAYSQAVKIGRFHSIKAFAAARGENNYDQFASTWSQAAEPHGSVVMRLFERETMINNDVVEDFAVTCGIDTRGLTKVRAHNEAISANEVRVLELLSRLEKRLVQLPFAPRSRHRKIARLFKGRRKFSLSKSMTRRIRALNAESNEQFRQRYFPDRPVLFATLNPREDGVAQRVVTKKIAKPHT